MLKKILSAIAAISLLAAFTVFKCSAAVTVSAKSAIVIEASTGTVLFEKDPDTQRLIASTTKIMTALVALENCTLDEIVTIPAECENVEGSSLYLKAGEQLTLRELLYGLMLESGNDAAVAIAYHVAGGIEAFAELMNERAEGLGCENTHFANPNGLDAEGHYSSARDLATIMAEAMRNELFVQMVSTKTISFDGRTFSNHNRLLWSYDGIIGGKTGYTMSAGRTLVSCAERDGMRLICVTLSDPDDWDDHMALYDAAFSEWEMFNLCSAGETLCDLPVISGQTESVGITAAESRSILVRRGDEPEIVVELPNFVYADVTEGDVAGYIKAVSGDTELCSAELVYSESVQRDSLEKLSGWEKITRALSGVVKRGLSKLGYEPEGAKG